MVVSLNHRLRLLGHLYLAEIGGDEWADSGNAGLLDVVLALEWTGDTVAVFGGDPERFTKMGCSAGSNKTLAWACRRRVGPGELHRLYEMPWEQLLSPEHRLPGKLGAGGS